MSAFGALSRALERARDPEPVLKKLLGIANGYTLKSEGVGEDGGAELARFVFSPSQTQAALAVVAFCASPNGKGVNFVLSSIVTWLQAVPRLAPGPHVEEFVEKLVGGVLAGIAAGMHGKDTLIGLVTNLFDSVALSECHAYLVEDEGDGEALHAVQRHALRTGCGVPLGLLTAVTSAGTSLLSVPLHARLHIVKLLIAELETVRDLASISTPHDGLFHFWQRTVLNAITAAVATFPEVPTHKGDMGLGRKDKRGATVSADVQACALSVFDLGVEESKSPSLVVRASAFQTLVQACTVLCDSGMFGQGLSILTAELASLPALPFVDAEYIQALCASLFLCIVDSAPEGSAAGRTRRMSLITASTDDRTIRSGHFIRDRESLSRAVNEIKLVLIALDVPRSPAQRTNPAAAVSPSRAGLASPVFGLNVFPTHSNYVRDALVNSLANILGAEMAEIEAEDVLAFSGSVTRDLLTSLSADMYSLANSGSKSSQLRQRLGKLKSKLKRGGKPGAVPAPAPGSALVGTAGGSTPSPAGAGALKAAVSAGRSPSPLVVDAGADDADLGLGADAVIDKAVAVVDVISRIVCTIDHPLLTFAAGEVFVDHFTRYSSSSASRNGDDATTASGAVDPANVAADIKTALVNALGDVAVLSSQREEYGHVCDTLMSTYLSSDVDPLRQASSTRAIPVCLLGIAEALKAQGSAYIADYQARVLRLFGQVSMSRPRFFCWVCLAVLCLCQRRAPLCCRLQLALECQRSLYGSDGSDASVAQMGSDLSMLLPAIACALSAISPPTIDPALIRPLWLASVLFQFTDARLWGPEIVSSMGVISAYCPALVSLSATGTRTVESALHVIRTGVILVVVVAV